MTGRSPAAGTSTALTRSPSPAATTSHPSSANTTPQAAPQRTGAIMATTLGLLLLIALVIWLLP